MKKKCIIIAEIGINHNGSLDLAKQLINEAAIAGCDAVKFQKRTIDEVYSPEELDKARESPFGNTNRDQKNGLEFSLEDFEMINSHCAEKKIDWFVSCWDINSQKIMRKFDLKYNKVASAMLTKKELLNEIASEKKYTFISTGMSTTNEIRDAINVFQGNNCDFELMHCNSSYPMENKDANLNMISTLRDEFKCDVGYSGHERGLQISIAAVALGATSIERHITLDRTMYGSDQSASIEAKGLGQLVRDIRIIEEALGDGKKNITSREKEIREKLANPYWDSNES